MELKHKAMAGTLESSDIYLIVEPSQDITIELESEVLAQFGDEIKKVIMDTLRELNVNGIRVVAKDKGAIDPVIKSRVQTAVLRACDKKKYDWRDM